MLAVALALVALAFPHGEAVLRTPAKTVTVKVELAQTPAQKARGLSGRRVLPRNAGMAFIFGDATRGSFSMRNTTIPLSIAFWGKQSRIFQIVDMTPCRRAPCRAYTPRYPFWGALEVNQGAFRRWGVGRGDSVEIRS